MAPTTRDKRLNILVTEVERNMLEKLAERKGVTASDYVRLTIREQWGLAFGHGVEPLPIGEHAPVTKAKARKRK